MGYTKLLLGMICSYLLGSIPTAYLFGRVLKRIDIRKFGSGNVGATNALRVLGRGPGITVLVLDIIKGIIPVVLIGDILASSAGISDELLRLLLGIACICGHNWTVFLNFKGGKGIATTFGVLIGLTVKVAGLKPVLVLVIFTWLAVFIISGIVSLASVLSGLSLPLYMILFKQSTVLTSAGILLCLFVILRHKANLSRLLQGKEPRTTFRKHS
jgi:acyl phosphate:glycerol-3-phosphate acyltransferase